MRRRYAGREAQRYLANHLPAPLLRPGDSRGLRISKLSGEGRLVSHPPSAGDHPSRNQNALEIDRGNILVIPNVEAQMKLRIGKTQEGQTGQVQMLVSEQQRRDKGIANPIALVLFIAQRLGQ